MGINDNVKRQIREHMHREGVSQAELARQLGIPHQTVNQMLLLEGSRSNIPKFIISILDELGLELIVQPKASEVSRVNEDATRAILECMEREGVNQNQLARRLGVGRQSVNQTLRSERNRTNIPNELINMLEELGLELVVQPRRGE